MHRSDRSEFLESIDGEPPAFVVREVKVQVVDLVSGQQVDKFKQVFLTCKITGYIQHETPVTKIWREDSREVAPE